MVRALPVVVGVIGIVIALLLGSAIVGQVNQSQKTFTAESEAAILDGPGTWVGLDEVRGENETVVDSRGYAIELSPSSDSYWETTNPVDVATDANWTVSVWANVSAAAGSSEMTVLDVDGRLIVYYNGSASEWTAWYYEEGTRNSHEVSVAAPDQPGNLTNVKVRRNASALQIHRNLTSGESVNPTTDAITDAPTSTTEFDGEMDEVRAFDSHLGTTQLDALTNNPIDPRTGTNRSLRIMFDQPDASEQLAFFADTDVAHQNVGFVDTGHDGQTLAEDTDYKWAEDGPEIRPLAGGEIDGAPVTYVSYDKEGTLAKLNFIWADFMQIAIIVALIGMLAVMISRLQEV